MHNVESELDPETYILSMYSAHYTKFNSESTIFITIIEFLTINGMYFENLSHFFCWRAICMRWLK